MGVDFDGFQPQECLMQEAKARYDQLVGRDGKPLLFFEGFEDMRQQAMMQAIPVAKQPPTRLFWYFMTPRAYRYMEAYLEALGITPVFNP